MKWHNINLGLRLALNSGTALVLYVIALYMFYSRAANSPTLAGLFPVAASTLTAAFGGFLIKRDRNNKIKLEAAKEGVTLTSEPAAGEDKK